MEPIQVGSGSNGRVAACGPKPNSPTHALKGGARMCGANRCRSRCKLRIGVTKPAVSWLTLVCLLQHAANVVSQGGNSTRSPTTAPMDASGKPTAWPKLLPTTRPTVAPSPSPSMEPTAMEASNFTAQYIQFLLISEKRFLNKNETGIFEDVMESFSSFYGPRAGMDPRRINTSCKVDFEGQLGPTPIQGNWSLGLKYSMSWESRHTVVDSYANDFLEFINSNTTRVGEILIASGIHILIELQVVRYGEKLDPSSVTQLYQQRLVVTLSNSSDPHSWSLNKSEQETFQRQMELYTPLYGSSTGIESVRVNTRCRIKNQQAVEPDTPTGPSNNSSGRMLRRGRELLHWIKAKVLFTTFSFSPRTLQEINNSDMVNTTLQLTYQMNWTSVHTKVDNYSVAFPRFINSNLDNVTGDLQNSGIARLLQVKDAKRIFPQPTPEPSSPPTATSTLAPSSPVSLAPTPSPLEPTAEPTAELTVASGSSAPSAVPSAVSPSQLVDTASEHLSPGAIAGIAIGSASVMVAVLYLVHRQRSNSGDVLVTSTSLTEAQAESSKREDNEEAGQERPAEQGGTLQTVDSSGARPDVAEPILTAAKPGETGSVSLDKKQKDYEPSDVKAGAEASNVIPPGRRCDELVFSDEFDYYKDKNIEKMRTEVEGTVPNTNEMMSQAVTKALMSSEVSGWGYGMESVEIQASILHETHDWLRKTGATIGDRRAFMQQILNKIVLCVRNQFVPPDKASRTIRECVFLLGLELAEKIPETALIVTSMRKAAETKDLVESFAAFGSIEEAAVAPDGAGFGLVRYVSPKSVLRVMDQFRTGEIVVQDVAVRVKVLGTSETRTISRTII